MATPPAPLRYESTGPGYWRAKHGDLTVELIEEEPRQWTVSVHRKPSGLSGGRIVFIETHRTMRDCKRRAAEFLASLPDQ